MRSLCDGTCKFSQYVISLFHMLMQTYRAEIRGRHVKDPLQTSIRNW